MKLSYRGVDYESATTRRPLESETTAIFCGVEYVIQHFGEKLPAAPNSKYRGTSYCSCLSATQAKSRYSQLDNFADSDFFIEYSNGDRI